MSTSTVQNSSKTSMEAKRKHTSRVDNSILKLKRQVIAEQHRLATAKTKRQRIVSMKAINAAQSQVEATQELQPAGIFTVIFERNVLYLLLSWVGHAKSTALLRAAQACQRFHGAVNYHGQELTDLSLYHGISVAPSWKLTFSDKVVLPPNWAVAYTADRSVYYINEEGHTSELPPAGAECERSEHKSSRLGILQYIATRGFSMPLDHSACRRLVAATTMTTTTPVYGTRHCTCWRCYSVPTAGCANYVPITLKVWAERCMGGSAAMWGETADDEQWLEISFLHCHVRLNHVELQFPVSLVWNPSDPARWVNYSVRVDVFDGSDWRTVANSDGSEHPVVKSFSEGENIKSHIPSPYEKGRYSTTLTCLMGWDTPTEYTNRVRLVTKDRLMLSHLDLYGDVLMNEC